MAELYNRVGIVFNISISDVRYLWDNVSRSLKSLLRMSGLRGVALGVVAKASNPETIPTRNGDGATVGTSTGHRTSVVPRLVVGLRSHGHSDGASL